MIKRMNKNISMVLAMAAMVSLVPSQGAFAASKLEVKEGTFENAMAFKDGKFVFDGYETDDDDAGVYFNNGTKAKLVQDDEDEDLDGAKLVSRYGEKYAVVDDGDEYILDLETGKVLDDEVSDKEDDAKNKLKSTLKKVDRYEVDGESDITEFNKVKDNTFGEVWYQYKANTEDTKTVAKTDSQLATVIVDAQKVSTGSAVVVAGKTIEKVSVTREVGSTGVTKEVDGVTQSTPDFTFADKNGLMAALDTIIMDTTVQSKYDVEGKDGIYTFVAKDEVELTDLDFKGELLDIKQYVPAKEASKESIGGYIGLTNSKGKYIDVNHTANINAYSSYRKKVVKLDEFNKQDKDSKLEASLDKFEVIAQDKDYFYAIATVTIIDDGTSQEPVKYLQKVSKAQGDKEDEAYLPKSVVSYQLQSGVYDESDVDKAVEALENADEVLVKGGKLLAVELGSDDVTVTTISLKQAKLEFETAPEGYSSNEKVSVYTVIKDEDEDEDFEGDKAYSIDVEGNLWILNKGKIMKFDGGEFKTMYTCDRSMDSLDVYDDENLVVWEEGEDAYSVAKSKSADKDKEDVVEDEKKDENVVTNGWKKDGTTGLWSYVENGNNVKSKWVYSNNAWYYLDETGTMKTGWLNDNGVWYYLQSSGAMKTGWLNDNGTWYFLQANGAMKTGWLNDNGTWYYLQSSGAMAANTVVDGYKLNASGAWVK